MLHGGVTFGSRARAQIDLTTKSLQKQRLGSWLVQAKAWLSGDWWL